MRADAVDEPGEECSDQTEQYAMAVDIEKQAEPERTDAPCDALKDNGVGYEPCRRFNASEDQPCKAHRDTRADDERSGDYEHLDKTVDA